VNQKYIALGLAGTAFVVTLGISFWRDGPWGSDRPSAQTDTAAQKHAIPVPAHPFAAVSPGSASPVAAPSIAAQAAAAAALPAAPPPQPIQSPPQPDAGNAQSVVPPTAPPDPYNEQSQDDYKQREKLFRELAEKARTR
jgi:hypothetical protein